MAINNDSTSGDTSNATLGSATNPRAQRKKKIAAVVAGAAATVSALIVPNSNSGSLDTINGCGLSGRGNLPVEVRGNPLKNRWSIPEAMTYNANVSLEALINAKSNADDKKLKEGIISGSGNGVKWSESDSAVIDGYIAEVKMGGQESCNCETNDPQFMDTHVYISATPNETDKKKCMIVEVTPRLRQIQAQIGPNWSTTQLISTLKVGTHVRISGWLFDDVEHFSNSVADTASGNLWRSTCWEIHPVTDIKILTP